MLKKLSIMFCSERFFLQIQNTSNNGRVRDGFGNGVRLVYICYNDPTYFTPLCMVMTALLKLAEPVTVVSGARPAKWRKRSS